MMLYKKSGFIFVLLLSLWASFSFAQDKNSKFPNKWAEIDTLIISRNLTKTALAKVNILYQQAKKENNSVQIIKSLIYRLSLEEKINETDPNRNIYTIKTEINTTKDIAIKCILYSILAKQYQAYFNNHRWQLYNRSQTSGFKKEDINTWNTNDFQQAITKYYLQSISPSTILQQTKLDRYDAVIIKGNTRKLRPTLYDLLAHEALDYFKTGEAYITKPSYAFVIDNPKALAKTNTFLGEKFSSKDSDSHLLICLQLFQSLIGFHKKDSDPDALIDINIERITWVNQQAVFENKDKLYKDALSDITDLFKNNAASADAWYLLARIEADLAQTYLPFGDTTHRFGYFTALQIAEKTLHQFKGDTEGTANLKNLIAEIKQKEIQLHTEQVNIPGKPFRTLVTYKNVDTLYGRIINIENNDSIRLQYDENYWKYATQLPSIKNFNQELPATHDYQQHEVEIKIDALPVGEYALVTSGGKQFNPDLDKIAVQFFYVSNISYIRNKNDYFVVNRMTGKPIDNASVAVFKKTYNNTQKKYNTKKIDTKYTDKNGWVKINSYNNNNNESYELIVESKNDRLNLHENEYLLFTRTEENKNLTNYEKENARIFFFTDRSIYRPGQKVFFKGIAITKDKETFMSKLYHLKDSIQIYLKDVNDKEIDSVRCLQNEFGSFTNSFIIPQNVLTGTFTIEAKTIDDGTASFTVEEYKRPQFYTSFEKVKDTYELNDSITLTGYARAFAGNVIDGAKVKFNVKRSARFIHPWLFYKTIMPQTNTTEIAHGEMVTDATGKYTIRFNALPDLTIKKETDPVFDFSLEAEVTDLNGETRNATTNLSIGYKSLLLQIEAPDITECDSVKKEILISTKNSSGEKKTAMVRVKIYQIQSPSRLIRKRMWQKPDQFILSKLKYIQYFPNDDYDDETNYQNWATGEILLDKTINTDSTYQIMPDDLKLNPGYYKIEATTFDKHNQAVKDIRYIQLFNNKQIPAIAYNFSYPQNKITEPGKKVMFVAGTSSDSVFVIRQTIRPNKKQDNNFEFIERNKGLELIAFTPEETDRGGVFINEIFVKDNRVYTNIYKISVPWTNKELRVNYKTYRNKTEPGSKENWTVTINGIKGDKAAAELLTTLYDASLDQFVQHDWILPDIWPINYQNDPWYYYPYFSLAISNTNRNTFNNYYKSKIYDQLLYNLAQLKKEEEYNKVFSTADFKDKARGISLINFKNMKIVNNNLSGAAAPVMIRGNSSSSNATPLYILNGIPMENFNLNSLSPGDIESIKILKDASDIAIYGAKGANGVVLITTKKQPVAAATKIRKNFSETAFFFPQLHADSPGNYSFSFTMPESLTQWKWMSFAHTKDLAFGSNSTIITTQKTLMVQPNAPRFMREGDHMEFVAKIANLSDKELTGQASLELIDATTNTPIDGWFQNIFPVQYFTVSANQSSAVKFPIQIPFGYNKPLTYRVVAKAGQFSDGEENTLPVLTNRMLVTESLPLLIHSDTIKHIIFKKLTNNLSETLTNESLTVEYTENPIWYAVQALPYLMDYPYECAEQTFNRLFANSLASSLVNKYPRIKAVFERWKNDTIILKSNLQKNEELKQVLLQETPWVLQAESEEQQKKNIALLFDIAKMSTGIDATIEKLKQMQLPSGAFGWFKGGYEDRYITNYIMTGIGKLKKAGTLSTESSNKLKDIIANATHYLDDRSTADYQQLIKIKADLLKDNISGTQVQYLYMKSFFINDSLTNNQAYQYYYKQAKQFWVKQNLYNQAMLGLVFFRHKDQQITIKKIIPSITENAISSPEQGMYWKETYTSFWYQSPIEYQSLMMTLINEVNEQQKNSSLTKDAVNMQTWLLLNKQTNNWKTTVATADACYALLNSNDQINTDKQFTIQLGTTTLNNKTQKAEAGSGYFKKRIEARLIKPEMGNITITTQSLPSSVPSISFANIYWQYFEDMDKITEASSPLSLHKKLFIEKNSDKGKMLTLINEGDELKVGDKVIVRLELKSDRDMEYLHLKDMRGACMEPVNVLSSYKWQDGLGYYEATKDASTNFFISNLNKGTYVFEYPLYITHTGTFSVGIATIQCMYAPEFSSHSEGIKISVNSKP